MITSPSGLSTLTTSMRLILFALIRFALNTQGPTLISCGLVTMSWAREEVTVRHKIKISIIPLPPSKGDLIRVSNEIPLSCIDLEQGVVHFAYRLLTNHVLTDINEGSALFVPVFQQRNGAFRGASCK